jgi:hypothetical protein
VFDRSVDVAREGGPGGVPRSGHIAAEFLGECLNGEIFYNVKEAIVIIEQWCKLYNTVRPCSSLNYRPLAHRHPRGKSPIWIGGRRWRFGLGDDRAVKHVEGGEQRGCAVALVVVGDAFDVAEPHGKHGLGAFEGLDLALLVDAKHHSLVGRIEISPTTSRSFSTKKGSVESLKLRVR